MSYQSVGSHYRAVKRQITLRDWPLSRSLFMPHHYVNKSLREKQREILSLTNKGNIKPRSLVLTKINEMLQLRNTDDLCSFAWPIAFNVFLS